jgi:hypothetical protein
MSADSCGNIAAKFSRTVQTKYQQRGETMRYVWIVLLTLLISSCVPPAEEVDSTEDFVTKFHGSWALESVKEIDENGVESFKEAFGRLTYAPSGNMVAIAAGPDRDVREVDNLNELDEGEMRTVLTDFVAYTGAYRVDPEANTVTHSIQASLNPNDVGKDVVRTFEFLDEDRIMLCPEEEAVELIWKREQP